MDSYGRCANNKNYPGDKAWNLTLSLNFKSGFSLNLVDFVDFQMSMIEKYKFCLAFENSCEEDYLTEKYWQSLVAGCIPVVIGAPNIEDFAPANDSYIHYKVQICTSTNA